MQSGQRERVAIIGAGEAGPVTGVTLARLCLRAGFRTVLEDVLPSNLRRAAAEFITPPPSLQLTYAGTIEEAVRDANFVIDAVPDELESKLEILSLLDRMAPPAALFATPTETLSIADLASCTYRPKQCFGLRFFSLAPLAIELSYAPGCEPATVGRMEEFLHRLGARVTAAKDTRALP